MATRLHELTAQDEKYSVDTSGLVRNHILYKTLHTSSPHATFRLHLLHKEIELKQAAYSEHHHILHCSTDQEDTELLIIRGQDIKIPYKEYKSVFERSEL